MPAHRFSPELNSLGEVCRQHRAVGEHTDFNRGLGEFMKTKAMFVMMGCLLGSALIVSQAAAQQRQEQQPAAEKPITVTSIPGVIAAGTKVERVWTGLQAADGLISEPDGTLLLPEQRANRISRFDKNGKITLYLEDTNEAGGIALVNGRVIAVERNMPPRLRVLAPERKVLADSFEGKPLQRLADIVADRKGGVYFTEGANTSVYYFNPGGKLTRVANDIKGANGVMLSPDDKTLYVTNTEAGIVAYDVQPDGSIRNRRPFVKPEGGQDGLCVDAAGRLYVASDLGIQVFSPQGQHLGLIPTPRGTTTLAFAGPDKKTIYVIGRGNDGPGGGGGDARSMYKISMLADGIKGRAK
jgi:gluconolactonase